MRRADDRRDAHDAGASWLKLVERRLAELTNNRLCIGAHRSVRALKADIRAWTKTAEQILESTARHCNRIYGSGHERNAS